MNKATAKRTAVCMIANSLRKEGYSASEAFTLAWHRVRDTKFRAVGVTWDGRQDRLKYLRNCEPSDLAISYRREPSNQFDENAIQILVTIKSQRKFTVIGYVPRVVAAQMARVMDRGIEVKADSFQIIGGYGNRENLGLLVNMAVA